MIRVILKYTGLYICGNESNPPGKGKHTNSNQVRDVLMVIASVYILKPFKMLVALAYDFLYQMARILSAVPVGMDACPLNINRDNRTQNPLPMLRSFPSTDK